jgi:hypothetical protein
LSGVFSCIQVAKFFPVWLAVLITIIVGLLLVGSLVTSLGNDLLDVAIGCVVVIVVMAVVLPVGAKAFRRHFPVTGRVEQSRWPNHRSPEPSPLASVGPHSRLTSLARRGSTRSATGILTIRRSCPPWSLSGPPRGRCSVSAPARLTVIVEL